VRLVVTEAFLLGLLGVLVGSVLGGAAVAWSAHTGINLHMMSGVQTEETAFAGLSFSTILYPVFHWRFVWQGVIAVTLTAVLAATWPALLVARLHPAEAMRS
jgi:ABC-type antimicrobial peptide transport system permease subunit